MLYGCVEGCGLGCAGCLGAAYPSHYDPYTGEKIEGLGILPPPAYVTAPPGAFTYYKPQPVIGKGVSFLPKVGDSFTDILLSAGQVDKGFNITGRIDRPMNPLLMNSTDSVSVDAAEKQLAVMPDTALSGKTILVAAAAIAVLVGYRNWKKR